MKEIRKIREKLEEKLKRKPLRKRKALLFLGQFVLSFFVPPILTVFYLIDLYSMCDKEQKKERLRRRLWDMDMASALGCHLRTDETLDKLKAGSST